MNTCDTCKWWGWWPGFEERNDWYPMKPCNHPKVEGMAGQDKGNPLDAACIENAVDSYIVTGPKFGCIHYEAK